MNFKESKSVNLLLYDIMSDLDLNTVSRESVLKKCVEKKLTMSEENYNTQMAILSKYLLSRDNLKMLKALAKIKEKRK